MTFRRHSSSAPTAAERDLRAAFIEGKRLGITEHLRWHNFHDGAARNGEPVIRACVLRELMLSKAPSETGRVAQLNISGVTIRGVLDLRFAEIDYPVHITNCTFEGPVMLSEARLQSVSLNGCTGSRIDAQHVTVKGDLNLDKVRLRGPLRLTGAHLDEDLHLADAHIILRGRRLALNLANIHVKGNLEAADLAVRGKVTMNGAHIDGSVRMTRAKIHARPGTQAWDGDGMEVAGELDGSRLRAIGKVRLVDARVLSLNLRGAHIENSEVALLLDRLESGSVFLSEKSLFHGGVSMISAQVRSSLYLGHAVAQAAPGDADAVAVNITRATVAGDLRCEGIKTVGNFNLAGAHIGGQVYLCDASLRAADDSQGAKAFTADRAEIGGDLFSASHSGQPQGFACVGTTSLIGTRIGGQFGLLQSRDGIQSGNALIAQDLSVARGMAVSTAGIIDLNGAEINGELVIDLQYLQQPSSERPVAADLGGVRANVLTLYNSPQRGLVDLTRASVRLLRDNPTHWSNDSGIVLEGFEYDHVAAMTEEDNRPAERLAWVKMGSQKVRKAVGKYENVGFTPQPYQQMARVYQNEGKDKEAREILHAMYHNHNAVMIPWRRLHSKLWNYAQELFLGYGYVPWRALVSILVLSAGATIWFSYLDKHHIGIIQSAVMSLGIALPGSGYDRIEKFGELSPVSHAVAAALLLCGLVLGATVIAAVARIIKQLSGKR